MRVAELETTINGEFGPFYQGEIIQLLRLQGCNLNCSYCDATQAQKYIEGDEYSMGGILAILIKNNPRNLLITGGEPLPQLNSLDSIDSFMNVLLENKFTTSIETNGSILPNFNALMLNFVVDYKLPSSGEMDEMHPIHVYHKYFPIDRTWWKFVIGDLEDYEIAKEVMFTMKEWGYATFGFSPMIRDVDDQVLTASLMHWMIQDELFLPNVKAILNLQVHKFINAK